MTNPLIDIVPAKGRRYLYAAYSFAGLIAGALAVAGVDIGKTPEVLAFVGVGIGATAASNAGDYKPRHARED